MKTAAEALYCEAMKLTADWIDISAINPPTEVPKILSLLLEAIKFRHWPSLKFLCKEIFFFFDEMKEDDKKNMVECLVLEAENNNAEALVALGDFYAGLWSIDTREIYQFLETIMKPCDFDSFRSLKPARALDNYRKAAKLNNLEALSRIVSLYVRNKASELDLPILATAFETLRAAIERANPMSDEGRETLKIACWNLFRFYETIQSKIEDKLSHVSLSPMFVDEGVNFAKRRLSYPTSTFDNQIEIWKLFEMAASKKYVPAMLCLAYLGLSYAANVNPPHFLKFKHTAINALYEAFATWGIPRCNDSLSLDHGILCRDSGTLSHLINVKIVKNIRAFINEEIISYLKSDTPKCTPKNFRYSDSKAPLIISFF